MFPAKVEGVALLKAMSNHAHEDIVDINSTPQNNIVEASGEKGSEQSHGKTKS
jgi:hypothetical protein